MPSPTRWPSTRSYPSRWLAPPAPLTRRSSTTAQTSSSTVTRSRPYTESDPPNPQSVYGQSKLMGEWLAADAPRAYVLRVESLFGGPAARSSIDRIIASLRSGEPARVFVDRVVTPSFVDDVVDATWSLLTREAEPGLYHVVNTGETTWHALGAEAARLLGTAANLRARQGGRRADARRPAAVLRAFHRQARRRRSLDACLAGRPRPLHPPARELTGIRPTVHHAHCARAGRGSLTCDHPCRSEGWTADAARMRVLWSPKRGEEALLHASIAIPSSAAPGALPCPSGSSGSPAPASRWHSRRSRFRSRVRPRAPVSGSA